jgi:serine/threonine-protein kinase
VGCAISGGQVWCWNLSSANNSSGQLGNGLTGTGGAPIGSLTPTLVVDESLNPLTGMTQVYVEMTGQVACAVGSDGGAATGAVWCWGNGTNRLFGNSAPQNSNVALPITLAGGGPLASVTELAVSSDHICALTNAAVWCWGHNNFGQVGIGTDDPLGQTPGNDYVLHPTQVSNLNQPVVDLAVTGSASCAVTTNGNVYCWGSESSGQLGNGQTAGDVNQPPTVDGGAPTIQHASRVFMNDQYLAACAVLPADGSIWCWGNGSASPAQLLGPSSVPVAHVGAVGPGQTNTPCYFDQTGVLFLASGVAASNPPTCP